MSQGLMHPDEMFNAARRLTGPEARAAYLDQACCGDAGLRAKVEALLAAHEAAGSFLASPAGDLQLGATLDQEAPSQPRESPGTVVGPYKLLQQIGEGGMGVVFLAEQQRPVRRQVAVKVVKAGMDTRQVIARFEAERQALALMDHPNIARVLDAGATESGRPYFVMELVKGVPITRYCDEHRVTVRERLELFVQVCQAVQHAHQKGVIHRDLKPTNVLVALYDGTPVPKVIDFGVAKATGARLTEATLFTGFGAVVGTPEYMSPEQAELNQLDVDTRSDVYSLGVLLYELLTGTTPLDRTRFKEAAVLEILRLVREEEPPRPSTRLSTTDQLPSIAAQRGLEPKKLSGVVRGELDWIVMKALEKDRSRRYETASGLAKDVERYLSDEPVQACPPSAAYRLRKFARRNKGPMAAAGLVLLVLLFGIAGTSWQAVRAGKRAEGERLAKEQAQRDRDAKELARQKEEKERQYAEAIADFVRYDFLALTSLEGQERFGGVSHVVLSKDTTLRQLLDRAAEKLKDRTDLDPRTEADLCWTIGMSYRAHGEPGLGVPFLERSVKLRKQLFGPNDEPNLDAQNSLAVTLQADGRVDLALPIYEEVLRVRKVSLGPRHVETLLSMNNLAHGYHAAGKLDLFLPLAEETVKLATAELGADHVFTLMCMTNLAGGYLDMGRLDLALPLVDYAVTRMKVNPGPDHPDTLTCINNLARCYGADGRFDLAISLLEETLTLSQAKLGDDHPDTLTTMHNLGVAYYEAGKSDMAVPLLEKCLRLRKAKSSADHPSILGTLHALAAAYREVGNVTEAIRLFEHVRQVREKTLGAEDPATLHTLHSLAVTYRHVGQMTDAIRLLGQVEQAWMKRHGAEHPSTLLALRNLAATYLEAGDHSRAIRLFEQVSEAQKKKPGPDHPATLATLCDLGQAYRMSGKLPEAVRLLEQVTSALEKQVGDGHSDTLSARTALAMAYLDAGKPAEGSRLLEQVAQIHARELGQEHAVTLVALANVATAHYAAGKFTEAIRLLEQVIVAQRKTLGEEQPDTLRSVHKLAAWYQNEGAAPDAIRLLEQVSAIWEKKLGADHAYTLAALNDLAEAHRFAGRFTDAIRLFKQVLAMRERELEGDHPLTLQTLRGLAGAYLGEKNAAEATRILQRVSEAQTRKLGAHHRETLLSLELLAGAHKVGGRLQEAIELYEQTARAWEKGYGRDHRNTLITLNNLAHTYWSARQLDRSIPVFEDLLKRFEDRLGVDHFETIATRANLGVNYRDAGRLDEALPLLEEAYRKGKPYVSLVWIGETLLTAYIKADKPGEAAALLREDVPNLRKHLPAGSPQLAHQLALAASHFLELKLFADAELLLRECHQIREKHMPDAWNTFNVQSMLGEALMGQKKYADAEPLLLAGYTGMKERTETIPADSKSRVRLAAERLVRLYEGMEKEDEAEKWRKELEPQAKAGDKVP